MKKRLTLLLSVLLLLCFGACSLTLPDPEQVGDTAETLTPFYRVEPRQIEYSEGYTPVTSAYAYNALPLQGEKELYTALTEAFYSISAELDEATGMYAMPQVKLTDYSLTEAQVRTAAKAVCDDHPEIFWATGTIGFYSGEGMTIVQVYSRFSPEEIDRRVDAVRAEANAFYATIPEGLSAYEREILVHDYLLEHITYTEKVDTEDFALNHPDIYTVYGALVTGDAVCEGYTRSFQMLLNGLGVDCAAVTGSGKDEMHIWNVVRLGGSWYNVDVTWDDREEGYARYMYFNVTDDYLAEDHTRSPLFSEMTDDQINGSSGDYNASVMNLFVPACEDASMGYYVRETVHLTDYDAAEVQRALLVSAARQDDYFVFYVEEPLDYDETLRALFVEYPQYFFSYINAVNDDLTDYSIDNSNISYYALPKNRAIAVMLHYY